MKYRITEEQNNLVNKLKRAKEIKEQEFIMQSFSPTANEGMRDGGAIKKNQPDVQEPEASGNDIYF